MEPEEAVERSLKRYRWRRTRPEYNLPRCPLQRYNWSYNVGYRRVELHIETQGITPGKEEKRIFDVGPVGLDGEKAVSNGHIARNDVGKEVWNEYHLSRGSDRLKQGHLPVARHRWLHVKTGANLAVELPEAFRMLQVEKGKGGRSVEAPNIGAQNHIEHLINRRHVWLWHRAVEIP